MTANVTGFNIQTAGTVLLVVGIVGLVLAVAYTFGPWWRSNSNVRRQAPPRD